MNKKPTRKNQKSIILELRKFSHMAQSIRKFLENKIDKNLIHYDKQL